MFKVLGLMLLAALPLQADGFDPRQPCDEILENANETTLAMVGAWSFGYLASEQLDARPVDLENVATILRNISKSCVDKKPISLLELVAAAPKPPVASPAVKRRRAPC